MDITNRIFVRLNYASYAIALRVEDVTIYCKTVVNNRLIWRDNSAVPETRDQLITIIVLQNLTD